MTERVAGAALAPLWLLLAAGGAVVLGLRRAALGRSGAARPVPEPPSAVVGSDCFYCPFSRSNDGATCDHTGPFETASGWNEHMADEHGVDRKL